MHMKSVADDPVRLALMSWPPASAAILGLIGVSDRSACPGRLPNESAIRQITWLLAKFDYYFLKTRPTGGRSPGEASSCGLRVVLRLRDENPEHRSEGMHRSGSGSRPDRFSFEIDSTSQT